jgi:hypothetical protein
MDSTMSHNPTQISIVTPVYWIASSSRVIHHDHGNCNVHQNVMVTSADNVAKPWELKLHICWTNALLHNEGKLKVK